MSASERFEALNMPGKCKRTGEPLHIVEESGMGVLDFRPAVCQIVQTPGKGGLFIVTHFNKGQSARGYQRQVGFNGAKGCSSGRNWRFRVSLVYRDSNLLDQNRDREDTGCGVARATTAPKSPPKQQREQRAHCKCCIDAVSRPECSMIAHQQQIQTHRDGQYQTKEQSLLSVQEKGRSAKSAPACYQERRKHGNT